jgi:hypothetical protein
VYIVSPRDKLTRVSEELQELQEESGEVAKASLLVFRNSHH